MDQTSYATLIENDDLSNLVLERLDQNYRIVSLQY